MTSENAACRELNHATSGCVPEPYQSCIHLSLSPRLSVSFPRSTWKRALFARIVAEVAVVVAVCQQSTWLASARPGANAMMCRKPASKTAVYNDGFIKRKLFKRHNYRRFTALSPVAVVGL